MSNAQLQIQFPAPGQWDKFTMTAVYAGVDGFVQSRTCGPADIPDDHATAFAAVATALVSMAADWQAVQVWARLAELVDYGDDLEVSPIVTECVELVVEVVNAQGGRRIFSPADYPEFTITDSETVAFFKYFTT